MEINDMEHLAVGFTMIMLLLAIVVLFIDAMK